MAGWLGDGDIRRSFYSYRRLRLKGSLGSRSARLPKKIRSIGGQDRFEAPNRFDPCLLRLARAIPFFLVIVLVTTANGATVTIAPRNSPTNPGVTIKTQYGYLNVTLTETFNSFTVYANGTIFFDVAFPTATQQGTYIFQTKSYGNGTMQLRFYGPVPQSVTASAATNSY